MALILNIETSSEICSVALSEDGRVIDSAESTEQRSHASEVTVLIGELLQRNNVFLKNLDAVAVSKGPGSYTGLRIGVSVAKGICYGIGKPLIGINTLQSMMHGMKLVFPEFLEAIPDNAHFCPMLDARRQEVYMAVFLKDESVETETFAAIIDAESFQKEMDINPFIFFGNGSNKCKHLIKHPNAIFLDDFAIKSDYMAELSEIAYQSNRLEDLAYFEPFYLKDFVATIPKRKII